MNAEKRRETWTFQPDEVVQLLVARAVNQLVRRAGPGRRTGDKRGMRSKVLNEALRIALAKHAGKRERA